MKPDASDGKDFDATSIRADLQTQRIGNRIEFFSSADSSQDLAVELAAKDAPEGLVVVVDHQRAGRGRSPDRAWESSEGVNLTCSILFRPPWKLEEANRLQFMSAVAAARTVKAASGIDVDLLWPNDLWVGGKKLGGMILSISSSEENTLEYAVIGIGVNLNAELRSFGKEVSEMATSLKIVSGSPVDRSKFTAKLLNELDELYEDLLANGFDRVREAWLERSPEKGEREVRLEKVVKVERVKTEEIHGRPKGIDPAGKLILELRDGREVLIQDAAKVDRT